MTDRKPEYLKDAHRGRWIDSESSMTFAAENPAIGEVIAHLPEGTHADARRTIEAANENKHEIAQMPVWGRSRLRQRIADEQAQVGCVTRGY